MTNLEPGLRLIDDLYLTADGLYRIHDILQPGRRNKSWPKRMHCALLGDDSDNRTR